MGEMTDRVETNAVPEEASLEAISEAELLVLPPADDLPSEADQAAFFARLDDELERAELRPVPAWQARTIGHLELNPVAYRAVVGVCSLVLVVAMGIIGLSALRATPMRASTVPAGYTLIQNGQGQVVAVSDRLYMKDDQERLRADALQELQALLHDQPSHADADAVQVSSETP